MHKTVCVIDTGLATDVVAGRLAALRLGWPEASVENLVERSLANARSIQWRRQCRPLRGKNVVEATWPCRF